MGTDATVHPKTRGRQRRITPKPGQLVAYWGAPRGETPDIHYAWGGAGAGSPDGRILCQAIEEAKLILGKTLRQELVERGYDLTTLRFSIQRKEAADA